jgi:hypothetical protein
MRLVGDIERLIKKKIDIEPFELVDDRPRRPPREREREFDRDRDRDRERSPDRPPHDDVAAAPRPFRDERPRRPVAAPSDPFFDKPYEPTVADGAKPAWEQKGATPPVPARGPSPNIRTKRKVASLLGGGSKP